ncbi:LysR family transcriptional regulator [Salinivibrio proteolyticus]|uniref:LysR family transcriptional regulator n=1 Tax=Salinivibrio proteolyticus TaxID=334715 RepID=UPI000988DAFF|nr:LysR family transcriptional regulator [Salinivibrio proteolyticus]OOF21286.1 LysR family transcriptional regulator [Salinivibrio proteolyticus]
MNPLRRIDLNQLVTLQALLAEKHISRAAIRLYKSQPAVSHSLAYLRKMFNDPLLVRINGQFELTPKAAQLKPSLDQTLQQLGALIEPPEFDPAHADTTIHLAMSDYGAKVILPELLRRVRSVAPNLRLVVLQGSRETMVMDLIDGKVDFAFGVFTIRHDDIEVETLFQEDFVCVADAATMPQKDGLDLSAWLSRPHLHVAQQESSYHEIASALEHVGYVRNVVMTLPHWGIAADLIVDTDLILTIASKTLDGSYLDKRLVIFEPPFDIESFEFTMIWHQRKKCDPIHSWLRKMIHDVINVQDD